MSEKRTGGGSVRAKVGSLLREDAFEEKISELSCLPERQVVNPLFAYLCSTDQLIKWRAVRTMGIVVSKLAQRDMESARIIMRRFIWNLNDESGGIAWGAPEAMGEIMASSSKLAREYSKILMSYISEKGNRLDNSLLERGVLWGIGRLAQVYPQIAMDSAMDITTYLTSNDPVQRGLALWALSFIGVAPSHQQLQILQEDQAEVQIFENGSLNLYRVCELASRFIDKPIPYRIT